MRNIKTLLFLFIISLSSLTAAEIQEPAKVTLSGVIRLKGEPLEKVTVTLMPGNLITWTDSEGKFSFNDLPPRGYELSIYHEKTKREIHQVRIKRNFYIEFDLSPASYLVPITNTLTNYFPDTSTSRYYRTETERMPGSLGLYTSPVKTAPGVTNGGWLNSAYSIRGLQPESTSYLVEGIPLVQPLHFSSTQLILDPASANSVTVERGAYPVTERYGMGSGAVRFTLDEGSEGRTTIQTESTYMSSRADLNYVIQPRVYGSVSARVGYLSPMPADVTTKNVFIASKKNRLEITSLYSTDKAAEGFTSSYFSRYTGSKVSWDYYYSSKMGLRMDFLGLYTEKNMSFENVYLVSDQTSMILRPVFFISPFSGAGIEAGGEFEYADANVTLDFDPTDYDLPSASALSSGNAIHYSRSPFAVSGGYGRLTYENEILKVDTSVRGDHYGDSNTTALSAAGNVQYRALKKLYAFTGGGLYQKPSPYWTFADAEDGEDISLEKTAREEAGAEYRFSRSRKVTQTIFAQQQRDLYSYAPSGNSVFANNGYIDSYGGETALVTPLNNNYRIRSSLTLLHGKGRVEYMPAYIYSLLLTQQEGATSHAIAYYLKGKYEYAAGSNSAGVTHELEYRFATLFASGWSYFFDAGIMASANDPAKHFVYDVSGFDLQEQRFSDQLTRSFTDASLPAYLYFGFRWRSK